MSMKIEVFFSCDQLIDELFINYFTFYKRDQSIYIAFFSPLTYTNKF